MRAPVRKDLPKDAETPPGPVPFPTGLNLFYFQSTPQISNPFRIQFTSSCRRSTVIWRKTGGKLDENMYRCIYGGRLIAASGHLPSYKAVFGPWFQRVSYLTDILKPKKRHSWILKTAFCDFLVNLGEFLAHVVQSSKGSWAAYGRYAISKTPILHEPIFQRLNDSTKLIQKC